MQNIVVFTGAGVSAESGLQTFRDSGGLWENYPVEEVATPEAWHKDPAKVLHFYNLRRQQAREAHPNAAHLALARLQDYYQVTIVTQNIDDLHERAGSSQVLHLHGNVMQARSSFDNVTLYDLGENDIKMGDLCEQGAQLRPHVVWFGEAVPEYATACRMAQQAEMLIVIGTSLQVYPAAALVHEVSADCPVILITKDIDQLPENAVWYQDSAVNKVPELVEDLISQAPEC